MRTTAGQDASRQTVHSPEPRAHWFENENCKYTLRVCQSVPAAARPIAHVPEFCWRTGPAYAVRVALTFIHTRGLPAGGQIPHPAR